MSNPTGNAIQAAAIPDAREARLLALIASWRYMARTNIYDESMAECAQQLEAALRDDA